MDLIKTIKPDIFVLFCLNEYELMMKRFSLELVLLDFKVCFFHHSERAFIF